MIISDCMMRDVKTCSPSTTVSDAVKKMAEHKVGSLVVVDGKQPVGIFTERDLLRRVIAEGKDPQKVPVADVMTGELFTVEANDFIGTVHHSLSERRIRHAPVIDKGVLVGIVSSTDLTRILDGQIYGLYFRKDDLSGHY